mmetsp:Transcript_31361/g.63762  ORF Transcript_31361/g.63762 Transcript_31361/m.63762 type:complete len:268 (+) Transcript_31361:190-993(+)|eukprot:CAMPEP_0178644570 /NCGR_PEP_ID=MMETSP0698-20121128/18356_1 /TAXON_ID=265572 /ORGANISM="Extubocellulus spinifer, Strain CCMP396" /LENGTH=267 /DNA_ID=CAMNT_0020285557 /DNA_START=98 /DNA_END=901 /DNA_ORIENTATION=-
MTDEVRPNPTTMEGMIWNANHVLEAALNPNLKGLPKALFENCLGVVLMHSVQTGFIFSACTGTGIALRKNADGSGWSPPCAIAMGGMGFGIMAGISAKDMVIFIMDEATMKSLTAKHGFKLGSNFELTIGPLGRSGEAQFDFTKKGVGSAIAVGYTKGVFGGINLEGAGIGPREFVNNKFYSKPTSAEAILYQQGSVEIPPGKVTMMDEVYDKLNKLQQGATAEPTAEEAAKKAAAKEAANKEGEEIVSVKEAEVVDAEAEAAKEIS